MRLEHTLIFACCAAVAVIAAIPLLHRRHRHWRVPLLGALAALALAAGGPVLRLHHAASVVVMIDLSPSTRGATYRTPALFAQRMGQLIGNQRYRPIFFGDRNVEASSQGTFKNAFPEIVCRRTIFTPVAADALIVLSDARFDLPNALPPTFVLVDPGLEQPADAAVTDLSLSIDPDGKRRLVAAVRNDGPARTLSWQGTADTATVPVPTGQWRFTSGPITADVAGARLNAGDAWPENDAMSIRVPPAELAQRWWVSSAAARVPTGWRALSPADLPDDGRAYLGTAVVVLNDVPADAISPNAAGALDQFVRQLGGGLVLLGGTHAFAAGGYAGTTLESLSPLASVPPEPRSSWIILTDASGSMAQESAGRANWRWACDAATHLLAVLPPKDQVYLGSFAQDLTWWAPAAPAATLVAAPPSPPAGFPSGPTNLQAALEAVARDHAALGNQPAVQVVLVTDAEASIDDVAALAKQLIAAHARVHLLALAPVGADNAVVRLVRATGGSLIEAGDVQRWNAAARQLAQAAQGPGYDPTPATLDFLAPLGSLPGRTAPAHNSVWSKPAAQIVAQLDDKTPAGARWQAGDGRVGALAVVAMPAEAQALADIVAAPPRDPRFKASIQTDGPAVTARLDAADTSAAVTDLQPVLELSDGAQSIANQSLAQTAPGIYEGRIADYADAGVATLRVGTSIAVRMALPAGYAPEFRAVGNDHAAMQRLAELGGGRVIQPGETGPIDLPRPFTETPIATYLLIGAAVLVGFALVTWQSSPRYE